MSFSIRGRTAIVTGAANGIGLAIGRHFVEQGANVVFVDRDEAALAEEVGKSDEAGATQVFAGDLREKLTVANLLSAAIDAFDRIDILVNASRQVMATDPMDPEDDSVEALLRQNLLTSLRLSQSVAARMIKQAESEGREEGVIGSIVNLSSIAARRTQPELLAYSVSTAALDQMTRSMAVALAPHRIRVNAVAFGSVMSASLKGALKAHGDWREDITEHTPLHRIARAGEVAEAAQFLASDGAGFVTGEVLTVDGGRSLLDAARAPAH
ncbi:MAG: SDR family NAD(P)-dependent oxidoreductase [Hasllibacter sp.]